ncbi:MAG: flagellar export protein FliJ [Treponema sp.]|nr:flagellar export protein FliJ [Treponema sp.]
MKKFSFNLEKVLSLRKFREQETEIELGKAIGVLSEIERNIRTVAEERIRSGDMFAGNGAMIRSYMMYTTRLDMQKEHLLAEAARAELVVESCRSRYIEASRDRKVLDKLKDKQAAAYRKTIFAEETKALDDQAASRNELSRSYAV